LEALLEDLARQLLPRAMIVSKDMFEAGYLLMLLIKANRQVLWAGFLKKRVGGLSIDHRRFFEVRGPTMYYFQGENNGNGCLLKGAISLVEAHFSRPEPRQLVVHTPERDYVLESDDLDPAEHLDQVLQGICPRRVVEGSEIAEAVAPVEQDTTLTAASAPDELRQGDQVAGTPSVISAASEATSALDSDVGGGEREASVLEQPENMASQRNSSAESAGSDITQLAIEQADQVCCCLPKKTRSN
jgi:hypothetical protein